MNLQQLLHILRARWAIMLATLVITVGTTVAVSLVMPKRFTATATVVVDFRGIDPISGGLLPLLPMTGALATQIDIIKSHNVARKVVDMLKLADNPRAKELFIEATEGKGNVRDWLAELILKYLKVDPSRDSSVIDISYTGNDPQFAAAVANAIVQSYISTNLDLKVVPARQTNTFFNEQIKTLKDQVEKAQANLSAYQREKGIIATDERIDVENNRLNELSSQYVAAQTQSYDTLTRQRQVQEAIARGQIPDSLPDVVNNPVIQALKTNVTALESKLADVSARVGKNHPQYIALTAELSGVRQKLKDEMGTAGRTIGDNASIYRQREEQVKASLEAQRAKVLAMKRLRDDLAVLMREAESTQRAYDTAMGRMTQTKLESQTTQTNVMVINDAIEPTAPSSPKLMLNTLLSVVLGLMLAIGFALLREMSDRIVRAEVDLSQAIGLPVLGVVNRPRGLIRRKYPALT